MVDAHIDPYKRCADSHWFIRFCRCVLPGGQGRPPLQYACKTVTSWDCFQPKFMVYFS